MARKKKQSRAKARKPAARKAAAKRRASTAPDYESAKRFAASAWTTAAGVARSAREKVAAMRARRARRKALAGIGKGSTLVAAEHVGRAAAARTPKAPRPGIKRYKHAGVLSSGYAAQRGLALRPTQNPARRRRRNPPHMADFVADVAITGVGLYGARAAAGMLAGRIPVAARFQVPVAAAGVMLAAVYAGRIVGRHYGAHLAAGATLNLLDALAASFAPDSVKMLIGVGVPVAAALPAPTSDYVTV